MKNLQLILLTFFLLITSSLLGQRDRIQYLQNFDKHRIHFGFYLGLSYNSFKIDYNKNTIDANINVRVKKGLNIGLIADLRLHKNINLRFEPGLIGLSKRKLEFRHIIPTKSIGDTDNDTIRKTMSTYLHLPLILKFSTNRMGNIRPYVLSGISYDHNFSSNEEEEDDNSSGVFRLKTGNFMYELGVGIDVYFYYFKFSPSIRGIFALNNELIYDKDKNSRWTSPIKFLGTRGIFLTLAFEGLL